MTEALLPNPNPALANSIDETKLGQTKKAENLVRVLVSIPNEGHAPVEAYANRIVNFWHIGRLEERQKMFDLVQGLDDEYWKREKKPDYWEMIKGKRFEFFFFTVGRILTPLAREKAAEAAVKGNFDFLYFIDDDMVCCDDLFERLYRHDVDIVAPLAFTRNPPYFPVAYTQTEYWNPQNNKPHLINDVIKNYPKNKLFRCDAVGFGSVLIKMDVIRKMKQPYFMSTVSTGEDILFCYNATKVGAKVYMDSSTKIDHLSHPLVVSESLAMAYWEQHGMEIEKKNGLYEHQERNRVLLGD